MKKLFLIGLMFHLMMFVNATASSNPKDPSNPKDVLQCMCILGLINEEVEKGTLRINMAKSPIGKDPITLGFFLEHVSTPEQINNPRPALLHLKKIFEGSAEETVIVPENHAYNENMNIVFQFFKSNPDLGARLLDGYMAETAMFPHFKHTILADRYSPLTSNVYASIAKKIDTNTAGGGASA